MFYSQTDSCSWLRYTPLHRRDIICQCLEWISGGERSRWNCAMFLMHHIAKYVRDINHLLCHSDSCKGQNKNFLIICLWNTLVCEKKFRRIDKIFSRRSCLPAQRQGLRTYTEKQAGHAMFVPDDYLQLLKEARPLKSYVTNMSRVMTHFMIARQLPSITLTGRRIFQDLHFWTAKRSGWILKKANSFKMFFYLFLHEYFTLCDTNCRHFPDNEQLRCRLYVYMSGGLGMWAAIQPAPKSQKYLCMEA